MFSLPVKCWLNCKFNHMRQLTRFGLWTNDTKHLHLLNTSEVKCIFKLQMNWNSWRTYALTAIVWLCMTLSFYTQLSSNITITQLKWTHWPNILVNLSAWFYFNAMSSVYFARRCLSINFAGGSALTLDESDDENRYFVFA